MSELPPELSRTIADIRKKYGDSSLKLLKDIRVIKKLSGLFSIDLALEGGMPMGRVIEIYGPEAAGKTTLVMTWLGHLQRTYKPWVAWINFERSLDMERAAVCGMDVERLLLVDAETGEEGFDQLIKLVETDQLGGIAMDSVTAMIPKGEDEAEVDEERPALQARLLSRMFRRIIKKLDDRKCSLFIISQLREQVGKMYGNPEMVPGGRALKHYASLRFSVRKGDLIDETGKSLEWSNREKAVGHVAQIEVVKSKVSRPFRKIGLRLGAEGFDLLDDVQATAVKLGIIEKNGSWYNYADKKVQGEHNLIKLLSENQDILESLREDLTNYINAITTEIEVDSPLEESEPNDG